MRNIHIENSHTVWLPLKMRTMILEESERKYQSTDVEQLLNRPMRSMYIEWWAHNIGYYLTAPLCKYPSIEKLNKRFEHVDLEEWT